MKSLIFASILALAPVVETSHLRVGIVGQEPFIINESGIAPELWENVVKDYNKTNKDKLSYELISMGENVDEGIEQLSRNKLDVLIGPITINSKRSEKISFTQPFYESKIAILSSKNFTWESTIKPFLKDNFWKAILIFMGVCFGFGTTMWFFERKHNNQFKSIVWDGCWFVIVTITTTGYGDKVPTTRIGKIISSILMSFSYAKLPLIMGFSTFMLTNFSEDFSLENKRASVVQGTTGALWAQDFGKHIKYEDSFISAIDSLENKKVDALVFDAPALHYYLSKNETKNYEVYEQNISENYGFAIHDEDLSRKINLSLLRTIENNKLKEITNKWLFH